MKPNEIKDYYFTFGFNHKYPKGYVKIRGTFIDARIKMATLFGQKWAFQYEDDKVIKKFNLKEVKT